MTIYAKLLVDLPDIKAGAIFQSITKHYHNSLGYQGDYDPDILYYFHDDIYNKSVANNDALTSSYHYQNLISYCNFFDYDSLQFKPYSENLNIRGLEFE